MVLIIAALRKNTCYSFPPSPSSILQKWEKGVRGMRALSSAGERIQAGSHLNFFSQMIIGSKSICPPPHIAQLTLCGLLNVRRKFASPTAPLPGIGKLRIATQLCEMGCFFEFIHFISPISREGAIFYCSLNAFSVCKLTARLPVKQIPLRPHQPHPQFILTDEFPICSCGRCDLRFCFLYCACSRFKQSCRLTFSI